MRVFKDHGKTVLEMDECEALALIARLAGQIDYAKHFGHSTKSEGVIETEKHDSKIGHASEFITVVNKSKD
jgi:hypothetical protein